VKISELQTPCLIVDRNKVVRNIETMQGIMDRLGVSLRPHGKTAKNIDIINLFAGKHRTKITVSTLKEAEYYFANGITDILYAVGIAPNKLVKVAEIINAGANLSVVLESLEQVKFVAEFAEKSNLIIPVLIEIDCDNARAGIEPEDPALIVIGNAIETAENLTFKGIMTHAGGSYACDSAIRIQSMAMQERDAALLSAKRLKSVGLECEIVSIGSTPTATFAIDLTGITEVRAGVFVFQDLVMAELGVCDTSDIGLMVLTSVIASKPEKNWIITDAGWMALSQDTGHSPANQATFGDVFHFTDQVTTSLKVNSTNQEHGIIYTDTEQQEQYSKINIGDMLGIIPNHACATAAMHDRYYVTTDDVNVSEIWHRINGW
jgi:D-serine deaminase-like pyridoxal phosphate-dependent protein